MLVKSNKSTVMPGRLQACNFSFRNAQCRCVHAIYSSPFIGCMMCSFRTWIHSIHSTDNRRRPALGRGGPPCYTLLPAAAAAERPPRSVALHIVMLKVSPVGRLNLYRNVEGLARRSVSTSRSIASTVSLRWSQHIVQQLY